MIILGIETSCDETAVAVIRSVGNKIEVLSNVVASQIEIHKKYGGVVPEVAAREHVLNILPVVNEALAKAGNKGIDAIAVTVGPGLVTSLIVGVETARSLAYAWGVPVIPVNHIEGHIYANWIDINSKRQISNSKQIQNSKYSPPLAGSRLQDQIEVAGKIQNIKFPALILTVSGGHNMLVLMKGHGKYKIIGETLDDAAGEAFDKAAQMMNIGYPGGPAISAYAEKFEALNSPSSRAQAEGKSEINSKFKIKNSKQFSKSKINPEHSGQKSKIVLPRPMKNSGDYNFSFSGLKTALLYKIKSNKNWKERIPEYAHEFQQAIIDVLIHKTIKAAKELGIKTIILTGGVAANLELRKQMAETIKSRMSNVKCYMSKLEYTTDNAAMIAAAGYFKARASKFTPWQKLRADSNLEL